MTTNSTKQLEAIRRSGIVNMITEKRAVQQIAHENGFHALVTDIEEKGYPTLLETLPYEGEDVPEIKQSV